MDTITIVVTLYGLLGTLINRICDAKNSILKADTEFLGFLSKQRETREIRFGWWCKLPSGAGGDKPVKRERFGRVCPAWRAASHCVSAHSIVGTIVKHCEPFLTQESFIKLSLLGNFGSGPINPWTALCICACICRLSEQFIHTLNTFLNAFLNAFESTSESTCVWIRESHVSIGHLSTI